MRLRRQRTSLRIRERLVASDPDYKEMVAHATPQGALSLPQSAWDYVAAAGTLTVAASDHSIMLQFFRRTSYGSECIIRTWRGWVLGEDGRPRRAEGFPTPTVKHVKDDLLHNLVEMPHLAKFLPRLHAEEGDKPIGAY